jgi:methionyl aminopeptidase
MIPIRSTAEIAAIARAGAVVADALDRLIAACLPGTPTRDLDALARNLLVRAGADPLFEGFGERQPTPFPAVVCVCVNEEITHAIPGDRVLHAGDLVTVDLGARLEGWCADASRATVVGDGPIAVDPGVLAARRALLATARAATDAAIDSMAPGRRWSDAAEAARRVAQSAGCIVAPGFSGHGIGRLMHEAPRVNFYPGPRDDFILRPGMVLTVEPIAVRPAAGAAMPPLVTRPDGWTIASGDGSEACQFEQTVAVLRAGVAVLTRTGGRETGRFPS